MASNPVPDNIDLALALGEDIADGLDTHEVSIGVKQITAVSMRAAVTLMQTKDLAYNTRKAATGNAEANTVIADEAAKAFIGNASKVLKIALGNKWSLAWEPTGFPSGTTGVPRNQDIRLSLLGNLETYFTANPGQEVPSLGVSAAAAGAAKMALSNARDTAAQKLAEQKAARVERDSALESLRAHIRALIAELTLLLRADDPRWAAFGLNLPSEPDTPLPANELVLTALGGGNVLITWKRGKRATRYRLFARYTDEPEFEQIALAHDLSHTQTGLTVGKTFEVKIIAANESVETTPTETFSVVVG